MATQVTLLPNSSLPVLPDSVLREAKQILHQGGVLAFPTESSYALGVSPWDARAVRRLWHIKGRPTGKPILVVIGEPSQLEALVKAVPPAASVLMAAFWPGPMTIVFPAADRLPEELTAGTGTLAVRLTAYPLLAALLRQVGPLTGTSANRSGQPPAQTAQEIQAGLGSDVDLILDGGPTSGALPSTLVSTVGPPRLLREGPIPFREVETVLAGSGLMLTR
jgi:L-threonylcarbamoyladenylate synthase